MTTVKTPWLDGKHVVFGRVDDQASFDIVKRVSTTFYELIGYGSISIIPTFSAS